MKYISGESGRRVHTMEGHGRSGGGKRGRGVHTSNASDRLDDEFVELAALSRHAAEQLDSSFQLGQDPAPRRRRGRGRTSSCMQRTAHSPRGRRCAARLGALGTLHEN